MPRKLEHIAIDYLATTPEVLRLLMGGLSDEEAQWKPAPDRLSIAEVLAHLSHIEGHCFRARFDSMVAATNPEVAPYLPLDLAREGVYSGSDAEESFAHWEEQREANVEFLQSLDPKVLARTAQHPNLGLITAEDLLNAWAFHDLGQVRQITELVAARLFYPKLGPFQSQARDGQGNVSVNLGVK